MSYRGGRFIFTRIWGEDEDSLYATKIVRESFKILPACVSCCLKTQTSEAEIHGPKPIEIGLARTRTEKIFET